MIGGTVVEVIPIEDRLWINAKDRTYDDECAIYVKRNSVSECIKAGDHIWWQGPYAMWTPSTNRAKEREDKFKCGVDYDIIIERIGYSGVKRP